MLRSSSNRRWRWFCAALATAAMMPTAQAESALFTVTPAGGESRPAGASRASARLMFTVVIPPRLELQAHEGDSRPGVLQASSNLRTGVVRTVDLQGPTAVHTVAVP